MIKKNFFIGLILIFIIITIIIYTIQLINFILILKFKFNSHYKINNNKVNEIPINISFNIIKINFIKLFNNLYKIIENIITIYNIENISFNIDIILWIIFILLPTLYYFNFGKKITKIFEIIGRIIGVISFILTIINYLNKIKGNNIKEHDKLDNITSSLNDANYQLINHSESDLIFVKSELKINLEEDISFGGRIAKHDDIFRWSKNNVSGEINHFFDKNDYHFVLVFFPRIIMIFLNICLVIVGYLLYKDSFSSKKKVIHCFKKSKK